MESHRSQQQEAKNLLYRASHANQQEEQSLESQSQQPPPIANSRVYPGLRKQKPRREVCVMYMYRQRGNENQP